MILFIIDGYCSSKSFLVGFFVSFNAYSWGSMFGVVSFEIVTSEMLKFKSLF